MGVFFANVLEKLAGKDEEAFGLHHALAGIFGFFVRKGGVVKAAMSCRVLVAVDVFGKIFRDIAVEKHAQDVLFKVPAIDSTAQVVCDIPDGSVKFGALLVIVVGSCHVFAP